MKLTRLAAPATLTLARLAAALAAEAQEAGTVPEVAILDRATLVARVRWFLPVLRCQC